MNNIILRNIFFLMVILTIVSCTQESDIEIPKSDKALVLHSILHPDSSIVVSLTSSRVVATKEEIEDVKGAEVSLYEDGEFVDNLQLIPPNLDRGEIKHNYFLDYLPSAGKKYTLEAKKEGFESIESTTTVPQKKGGISKVDLVGEFEYGLKNIKVTINDTEANANYYHLVMYISSKTTEIFGTDTVSYSHVETPTYYELKNTSLGDGLGQDNRYGFSVWSNVGGYVFSDELFNNGSIVFNTNIYTFDDPFDDPNIMNESTVKIELRSINEDYFKYQRSLSLQQEAKDNALAEPVFLFNNIENGFGSFSAYNVAATEKLVFK